MFHTGPRRFAYTCDVQDAGRGGSRVAALLLYAVSTLSVACLESESVHCANGRVCPKGSICAATLDACVLEEQLAACDELTDGTECVFAGSPGTCRSGACVPRTCGDGALDAPEQCDGADVAGKSCENLGFYIDAPLSCTPQCTFDVSQCSEICGDGILNGDEVCDDQALGAASDCMALGYYEPGPVTCNALCLPNTSQCAGFCGDGIANGGEICDSASLGAQDCVEIGADAGALRCTMGCAPDFTSCGSFSTRSETSPSDQDIHDLWRSPEGTYFGAGRINVHTVAGAFTSLFANGTLYSGVWGTADANVFFVGAGGSIVRWNGTATETMASTVSVLLNDIWGTSGSLAFAVGASGKIVKYDGTAWMEVASGTANELRGISAGSSTDFVAVGANGTILEYDGQWSSVTPVTSESLNAVWVHASGRAFAVGQNGTILERSGGTWAPMASHTTVHIMSVWGNAPNDIYAVGWTPGLFLHYNGRAWTQLDSGANALWVAVASSGPSDVVIAGGSGRIRRYGGIDYQQASLPGETNEVSSVFGSSLDDMWIAASSRYVYQYVPTTRTWTQHDRTVGLFGGLWTLSGSFVLVAAHNGVHLWNGSAWSIPTTGSFRDVFGTGPRDVVAVGNSGLVRQWNGTTWDTKTPPTTSSLSTVWAAGPADYWIGGIGGLLMHYDGTNFAVVSPSPTTDYIIDISGTGPSDVWAVTLQGHAFHYDGSTWTQTPVGIQDVLLDVWAFAPDDVFAVGNNGVAIHWSGQRWDRVELDFDGDLHGVWGTADRVVFGGPAGQYGILHRTTSWSCSDHETRCGDARDNDCDGLIDANDSDCHGGVVLGELHGGSVDYVELLDHDASRASIDGLAVASSALCGASALSYELTSTRNLASGESWRLIEAPALQARESYLGCNLGDNPSDAHWYALCAGPCDLAHCTNMLDYVEKRKGAILPAALPCATFLPQAIDVSTEGASSSPNSLQRVGFAGAGTTGAAPDWTIGAMSRD